MRVNEISEGHDERMAPDHMDAAGKTYGISRKAGVAISLAAIALAAALILAAASVLSPSSVDDAAGVVLASLMIPVIALFKPLQEFAVLPDGLGFSTIFSKRVYKLAWTDVTDVRLKRGIFGIVNMEFKERDKKLYKKVPLTIIPERREFLQQLLERFPLDHPKGILLRNIISSYIK